MSVSVVIPVKDNLGLTADLIEQLVEQDGHDEILVFDNGSSSQTAEWLKRRESRGILRYIEAAGRSLYQMWNEGATMARRRDPQACIAFLNNDLRLGPHFLGRLEDAFRHDPALWAISPDTNGHQVDAVRYVSSTFKGGGLTGFAFVVRGEVFDRVSFDERFEWWFGDDDFVAQIRALSGRVGVVGDATVEHIGGGSQTVRYTKHVLAAIERDRRRMWEKWGRL